LPVAVAEAVSATPTVALSLASVGAPTLQAMPFQVPMLRPSGRVRRVEGGEGGDHGPAVCTDEGLGDGAVDRDGALEGLGDLRRRRLIGVGDGCRTAAGGGERAASSRAAEPAQHAAPGPEAK
jgi:hypothetical protein